MVCAEPFDDADPRRSRAGKRHHLWSCCSVWTKDISRPTSCLTDPFRDSMDHRHNVFDASFGGYRAVGLGT